MKVFPRPCSICLIWLAILLIGGGAWACQDGACSHRSLTALSPSETRATAPAPEALTKLLDALEQPSSREEASELVAALRQGCQAILRQAHRVPPRLADDLRQELDRLSFAFANETTTETADRIRLSLGNLRTLLAALAHRQVGLTATAQPSSDAQRARERTDRIWVSKIHPNQWYFIAKQCGLCKGTGKFSYSTCGICNGSGVIYTDPATKPCGFCKGGGWHQGRTCFGCEGTGWCRADLPNPNQLYEFRACAWCGGGGWTQNGSCSICDGDGWNQIPKAAPVCPSCRGSGRNQYGSSTCSQCRGTGYAPVAVSQPGGQPPAGTAPGGAGYPGYPPPPNIHELMSLQVCALCQGSGKFRAVYFCPSCGADGYVTVPNPPKRCQGCGGSGQINGNICAHCTGNGWTDGAIYSLPPGRAICKRCNGQGSIHNGVFCSVCNGQGWVIATIDPLKKACRMCQGKGSIEGQFCPACNGGGWARMVLPAPERP